MSLEHFEETVVADLATLKKTIEDLQKMVAEMIQAVLDPEVDSDEEGDEE